MGSTAQLWHTGLRVCLVVSREAIEAERKVPTTIATRMPVARRRTRYQDPCILVRYFARDVHVWQ